MKRRDGGRIWWLLVILLVAVAAGLAGYFIGMKKGRGERALLVSKEIPVEKKSLPQVEPETPEEKEPIIKQEIKETGPLEQEDYCSQIETGVQGFFGYLDKKNYIQHVEPDVDSYNRFKRLIRELSSRPPIPAGEGIDTKIVIKNIFYFSRLLDKSDLILIKEIMRNEADTLELNLEMFYKWLTLEEQCPDIGEIRPSLDVLYQYAGFLLNTIGGRSYLFRRPLAVRLLVSYYCLLIIHESDKRGKNSYGIDIFPEIAPLTEEISIYPDFRLQSEYLHQLTRLQTYYLQKR